MLTVGSLFAGIGGFDLGLERAGMRVRWQVEIDPYCQRVLAKHWPDVTRYGDIRAVDWSTVEPVDLLCGGFPCQDISLAGKGAGLAGERSGLWFEYAKAIAALRPRYVLIENVSALRSRGLDQVLGSLAALGYDAEWHCIPACAVGAPHRRDRVWIIAHSKSDRTQRGIFQQGRTIVGDDGDIQFVADANAQHRERGGQRSSANSQAGASRPEFIGGRAPLADTGRALLEGWGASPSTWWATEPAVGGRFNGIPNWLDRFTGGLSYAESRRSIEALRVLWSADVSEALWQTVGGYGRVEQAAVLFAFVREYEKDADQERLLMACQKAFEEGMRRVRREKTTKRSSRRSGQPEQSSGEYSDALQMVPQLSPCDGETLWACDSWEDGIARVAHGIPHRVDRLRGLGNAIVPQVATFLGERILAYDQSRTREAGTVLS